MPNAIPATSNASSANGSESASPRSKAGAYRKVRCSRGDIEKTTRGGERHLFHGKAAPGHVAPEAQEVVEEIVPAGDGGEYLLDHADALGVRDVSYGRVSLFYLLFSLEGLPTARVSEKKRPFYEWCGFRYMNLSKRSFLALHTGHISGGAALAHR
jgi:hypothetical protein